MTANFAMEHLHVAGTVVNVWHVPTIDHWPLTTVSIAPPIILLHAPPTLPDLGQDFANRPAIAGEPLPLAATRRRLLEPFAQASACRFASPACAPASS